jgi:hypothetical protein
MARIKLRDSSNLIRRNGRRNFGLSSGGNASAGGPVNMERPTPLRVNAGLPMVWDACVVAIRG